MKLIEYIVQVEKERLSNLTEREEPSFLMGESLKKLEEGLFSCDEFKNVLRINFLNVPSFLIDQETKEPVSMSREYLGGKTEPQVVVTGKYKMDQEIVFNKFVDIYSIQLIKYYDKDIVIDKPGVFIFPTLFTEDFEALKQIRVLWSPTQLQDALATIGRNETAKERLIRMFEKALDDMEPNIPCEYALAIRASKRSFSYAESTFPLGHSPKDNDFTPPNNGDIIV